MTSSRDPIRLIDSDRATASLLEAYAARTRAKAREDGAAWQRLQPALDERLPARRSWAQTRLLAGALTAALGLFVLARSIPCAAQLGLPAGSGSEEGPIRIQSDAGIEWQQNQHVYIARGNAVAA